MQKRTIIFNNYWNAGAVAGSSPLVLLVCRSFVGLNEPLEGIARELFRAALTLRYGPDVTDAKAARTSLDE
jgi:hypothetical protein